MRGIHTVDHSEMPVWGKLPKDGRIGKRVALKMAGGVGDVVMAIGSAANKLSSEGMICSGVCDKYQEPLVRDLKGVTNTHSVREFNSLEIQRSYDYVIDFKWTFNNAKELKANDYYELIEKRLGEKVTLAEWKTNPPITRSVVSLHAGASNPNRSWPIQYWEETANWLTSQGHQIQWLGKKSDFGYESNLSTKLSNTDESLLWQCDQVRQSSYFIGNDSGFAHIAGISGIAGQVIFGNTCPKDVLSRYPKLIGITSIDNPSRSLKVTCKRSLLALRNIPPSLILTKHKEYHDALHSKDRQQFKPVN